MTGVDDLEPKARRDAALAARYKAERDAAVTALRVVDRTLTRLTDLRTPMGLATMWDLHVVIIDAVGAER